MALVIADRVKESSTTSGTGTITLGGAVSGYQAFTAIGNGNQCYYTIVNIAVATEWEVGVGTYSSSTLTRDTVLSSSNAGAKVSFSAGNKEVFVTYPADRSVSQADIGTAANEIPLNQYLGSLAYQDLESVTINGGVATLDTATITSIQNDTAISNVEPSLMLNFAAVKKLDPRITYARASTGVYYDGVTNSKAEENLLSYSQEFDNAYWTKNLATTTANATTAPDGTTTADTITSNDSASGYVAVYRALSIDANSTLSVFAKAGTSSLAFISNGTATYAVFDLSAGSVVTSANSSPSITKDVSTGWCRLTLTNNISMSNFIIGGKDSYAFGLPWGNGTWTSGNSIYIWGAQLEQRSAVSSYTPTTTQPITLYQPTLLTAPSGVARFDHNPTTTESLGLLIEEQRTNLQTYSEDFSNAVYVATNSTFTPNQVVAPDGMLTGYKLTETATTGEHYFQRPSVRPAITSGTVYTFSWYAKKAGRAKIRVSSYAFNNLQIFYDLETGVSTYVSGGTSYSFGMQDVGDGWWRCFATSTANQTQHSIVFALVSTGTTVNYTGDGYSGIFIWGAQLEAGGFSTSYIPTVASQVTRSADSASMTGANLFSWFNPSQGTLYAEANHIVGVNQQAYFAQIAGTGSGTGYGESIAVGKFDSGAIGSGQRIKGIVYVINSIVANLVTASDITTSPVKVSLGYKVNDFGASIDEATALTDTSGVLPVINSIGVFSIGSIRGGGLYINSTIKKIAYFPARLSNEELIEMTS